MDAYYKMDPEERKLRKQKFYLYTKYIDDKISYESYLTQLDEKFYEVLNKEEEEEIEKFKLEREKRIEAKRQKETIDQIKRQKEKEEQQKKFGCIFAIILLIVFLIGLLL